MSNIDFWLGFILGCTITGTIAYFYATKLTDKVEELIKKYDKNRVR